MALLDGPGYRGHPLRSRLDAVRVAVAGRLINAGYTAREAARSVETALDPTLRPGMKPKPSDFAGKYLIVERRPLGLYAGIATAPAPGAVSLQEIAAPLLRRLSKLSAEKGQPASGRRPGRSTPAAPHAALGRQSRTRLPETADDHVSIATEKATA